MIGELWKHNQDALIKSAFALECSGLNGLEKTTTHNKNFELFQSIPVTLVTTFQGHQEWHIARRFSFTSRTTHTLIKTLLCHKLDLEYNYVHVVCEVMCCNYDYEKRVEVHESQEEVVNTPSDNYDMTSSSPDVDGLYTDGELLDDGVPELVEVWEQCQALHHSVLYE